MSPYSKLTLTRNEHVMKLEGCNRRWSLVVRSLEYCRMPEPKIKPILFFFAKEKLRLATLALSILAFKSINPFFFTRIKAVT